MSEEKPEIIAWKKWSDDQRGRALSITHSETFFAGYAAADKELHDLREFVREMWSCYFEDWYGKYKGTTHAGALRFVICDNDRNELASGKDALEAIQKFMEVRDGK